MNSKLLILSILTALLSSPFLFSTGLLAQTDSSTVQETKVSKHIQGDLVQKLEEAGLRPAPVEKIEPEGFTMPEIPRKIKNENLGPAEKTRMAQSEQKQAEGRQTQTEHNLEKDTLFREANLRF